MFMTKGNEWVWPKPLNMPFLHGYRCNVTNYGDTPVFNIDMALEEVFKEIIRDPNQPNLMQAGKIELSRKWLISIEKLDTGANNPFSFYIINSSNDMVLFHCPRL